MYNYNYLVYELWLIIPATVIAALSYVIGILHCCCVRHQSSAAGMVKFLLGDIVEKKEEEDGTKYLIQGHPLNGGVLRIVTIYSSMITSCALMTFWYEFLVDVTYSCDPNLDCYPVPPPSFTVHNIPSIPPIVNCSDYEPLPGNVTIVCFTFTFDYSQAFGAAGGVFAFAVFGIRTVIGIMTWLKSVCLKCCLLFWLTIFYIVLMFGGALLGTLVPVFRPLLLGPTRLLHFSVYTLTFGVGFCIIPMLFLCQDNTENIYTEL